jgi:hypothetical protein
MAASGGMRLAPAIVAIAFASISASAQPVPADLRALAVKARLDAAIAGWCRGPLRAGRPGSYVVAAAAATGGRYLALDADGTSVELASFTGTPELSCYTPAEARKLDRTIRESETIHGSIAPRWRTTVVCGFLDDTTAACWQYSPAARAFVRVGGWIT